MFIKGAEGYIYPYPLYDILTEKKIEKDYNVLRLNNQYVDIAILPEIGGRIFAASDKTNDYPFFYTQTGIKPALIGMLGAWLSGGVEWNIPDHHRASSYMPINWTMKENEDGSKTIWVGETELRHRLKWSIGISVYPNRSWVEAKIKVINPTPMIQSMLYWANVSVHCNDQYQVIFHLTYNLVPIIIKYTSQIGRSEKRTSAAEKMPIYLGGKTLRETPVLFLPGVVKCLSSRAMTMEKMQEQYT